MNIGMLLETLSHSGGVSRVSLALAQEFCKLGHEVHIYASTNRLQGGGSGLFSDHKIAFHWLPSLRGSWRTWSLPIGAMLPMMALPMGHRMPAKPRAGRRHDVVVSHALTVRQDVIDMHNDPQPIETEKLARVPFSIDPPRLMTVRREVRAAIERMRFLPGNYRSVLVHSKRSAREVRSAYGVPEELIDVIPHGVDSGYFSPALAAGTRRELRERLGISLDQVVFLYLGDSWKGLEFAIRGLALLPKKAPAVLLAAGPFPKGLFARFAREQGVRFIHHDLWDDVRSLYSVADALVNPTPLDTFFLVGLEAMAMRLPIVVTQYAGISELLTHGEDAFILNSPSDPGPIAEACAGLLETDVRLRMAEKARRFAVARPWEDAARLHLSRYAALGKSLEALPA